MNAENRLTENQAAALDRLFEALRIPSISTDPQWAENCKAMAAWYEAELASIGFDAQRINTGGHDFVVAKSPQMAGAPHVLFYGHYDVQPVDPLELWERDPFDPALIDRDGVKVIHGRGSSDDKGQVHTFMEACRACFETDGYPLNITVLLEGEEETGSPSLPAFLQKHGDLIRADMALICDTGQVDAQTPSIASQLRGLMGEQIVIKAASTDLHSGLYGGAARNPAHLLTHILAQLHDDAGRVTLEGFYDGVPETSPELKADWDKLDDKGKKLLADVGLSIPAGEPGYSIEEMLWSRPTLEINGIWSGYTGEGFKTVLPSIASAKVSCRLVGSQDPAKIRKSLRETIEKQIPKDCTVEFHEHGGSPASHMDITRPEFQKAKAALEGLWDNDPVFIGMGGSIPIVGAFKRELGMDSLLLGFALASDQIHAPNEKYNLESFQKGALAWLRVLKALAA